MGNSPHFCPGVYMAHMSRLLVFLLLVWGVSAWAKADVFVGHTNDGTLILTGIRNQVWKPCFSPHRLTLGFC